MARSALLSTLLLIAAWTLPGLACAQPNAAWYRGSFAGTFDGMQVRVSCDSQRICEATFRSAPPPAKPALQQRASDIAPVDIAIPANNLDHTRDAVQANPPLYDGPEGAMLATLRPLLESKARYRQCISGNDGDWGPLCQLDTVAPGLPDAVFLVPTMNATCNGQAFCAYFAVPLRRQPGG